MLFKSSREFFFAPVIEYGPLTAWKAIAGKGQKMQEIFWWIKEAIDAYFAGRAFEITVKAGCFRARRPAELKVSSATESAEKKVNPVAPPESDADSGADSLAENHSQEDPRREEEVTHPRGTQGK